jgi:two-component system sensor histidine kinase RegB
MLHEARDGAPSGPALGPAGNRSNSVRLRTLVLLRWLAILGQLAALTAAQYYFGLQLEYGWCYLAVGVSVTGNLVAMFVFPETTRLSERQNFLIAMFDLAQLGALLFLTGGLNNPFALLLLGPVTVSAAVLSLKSYLTLGATALLIASLLSVYHLPLRTASGDVLRIPQIFLFGDWLALVIGVVFFGLHSRRVTMEMNSMSEALSATQMALAREQKLTDLSGVVAAAAHELGTPLATIKLTSSELIEELDGHPELRADAWLIREQADRCRDILRDMGRAGKDDMHLRRAPLITLLQEAAEPHEGRGVTVHYAIKPEDGSDPAQPNVLRKPEIVHGLRNLVQNAVDYAAEQVWIEARWSASRIAVRIADDGPGFPAQILGRLGEPFMRRGRRTMTLDTHARRPEYEGMGLGLFIAKTLLERTGAELVFANGASAARAAGPNAERNRTGAIVRVTWPRERIDAAARIGAISAQNPQINP